ncbi:4-hydroxythreonine-4-phosphate dehydrogenase [Hydrogenovibrio crunogenus]|uniref:4-hydroxythreonine-4-phosphate dehydrogenase n=1 Tax=Hydrogenovibrio crunogenus TaxID=39765 RepID=A0A4P7P149_9GAMM|nr:4-hydroxythreonine-4-phosphate dehydrogenase PdxA [Hydrogenovibrio crunogenus]QBZ83679.1 4-hydroxythreonine-4-phosphate dehydrogenase [Hydrogenovibrio crunogenus]RUM92370.1 MAG: 4-hydroxythreonine-4-phosphate dehydrogenase PdxA [Thiomicrospira sp.]
MHRLVITSGEPAGIGPEQVIQLAQQDWDYEWVVIANKTLLTERAAQIGLPITLITFDASQPPCANRTGELKVIEIPLHAPVVAGQLNVKNADYVLKMLHTAIDTCQNQTFDAMVTGPIHKGIINQAGLKFTGHTELLAEATGTKQVVMMLATPGLRVPLVTTHLPLKEVPDAITPELLESVIRILHTSLKHQFQIESPKIFIMGLNPHAGEEGHLGREEIDTMNPVIASLQSEGMDLIGPLPADTIFSPSNLKVGDAFLAMYHDQGLPVLKYVGFGNAVNITLGLPFIRTSVDHGTALNLAGTGQADINSFRYAMDVALEMTGKDT